VAQVPVEAVQAEAVLQVQKNLHPLSQQSSRAQN
jgi:hypothetical protein